MWTQSRATREKAIGLRQYDLHRRNMCVLEYCIALWMPNCIHPSISMASINSTHSIAYIPLHTTYINYSHFTSTLHRLANLKTIIIICNLCVQSKVFIRIQYKTESKVLCCPSVHTITNAATCRSLETRGAVLHRLLSQGKLLRTQASRVP